MSSRAKQLMGGILIASAVLIATSIEASAHTGTVHVQQDCEGGSASVVLNHNTTSDRSVDVVTTIPGTSGFTGHHYGTSFGQIWTASWPTPRAGKVTLNIYRQNGSLEFTESKTLQPVYGCVTTTTSTTTIPPTTTTTEAPVVTTTTVVVAPTTTSTVPPVQSTTTSTVVPDRETTTSTVAATTSTSAPKRVVNLGPPITAIQTPPDALPRTGSSSLPLAVGGFASALAGSFALALTRKKKAAR